MADKTAFDVTLYSQYLGALALLGRLVDVKKLSLDDKASVERAFKDGNMQLEKRGSKIRFQKASNGGYAAFDK